MTHKSDIATERFQTLLEPLNLELYIQENIASWRDMDVVSRSRSLGSSRNDKSASSGE
jgi:hypothetical protein